MRPGSSCKILVVMDGLETIKPGMDSTMAIVGEAHGRGHAVDICRGEQLAVRDGAPVVPARPVTEMAADEMPMLGDTGPRQQIGGYDAVLIRKNPPVDRQYFYETLMLERLRGECLFMNDPRALREVNEKLAVLEFPEVIPRTLVTREIPYLQAFLEECGGDIVVKPLDGYSGHGVLRVTSDDQNRDALLELATDEGTRLTMAQSYIPGAELGDKRILMLNGIPIAAVVRRPAPGLLRGNTRAGATLEPASLTARDQEICADGRAAAARARPVLRRHRHRRRVPDGDQRHLPRRHPRAHQADRRARRGSRRRLARAGERRPRRRARVEALVR